MPRHQHAKTMKTRSDGCCTHSRDMILEWGWLIAEIVETCAPAREYLWMEKWPNERMNEWMNDWTVDASQRGDECAALPPRCIKGRANNNNPNDKNNNDYSSVQCSCRRVINNIRGVSHARAPRFSSDYSILRPPGVIKRRQRGEKSPSRKASFFYCSMRACLMPREESVTEGFDDSDYGVLGFDWFR